MTKNDGRTNYVPRPLDTDTVELPEAWLELRERIAEQVHDVWAAARIEQGWTWGAMLDETRRTHPNLIAYDDLSEQEKEMDRQTATQTLKVLVMSGWTLTRS